MNFLKFFRKLKDKIAKNEHQAPDPDPDQNQNQNQNQAQHPDEDQAPHPTAATNSVGFPPNLPYPAPTIIHYGLRAAPITIFSNPKPRTEFTNYVPDFAPQIHVAATKILFSSKKPEFTSSLPNPRSDTIDPSYYLYQSPVPKAWAVKKHTSKLISPHSTTTPISISSSLRSNHFNRPRYGLSQSLVVQSSFKACGLVVICGNREDEYTGGLYEDDRSNEEEAEEAETDGGDTELLMEMENDDWSLPLSPLQNWENFQDHQSTTDQTGSPKSWEFQLTPPGMSYWAPTAPTAPTQTPEPKVECPKWKPNHTAAGILRDEEWMSAFEKIPATYLRPLQSSSILSKHFCPSRNTSQGQEPQKTLPNSPTASMTIDSESDFKSFPKDLSSLRAIQQEADAKRNFAGERDIWRHHADMISAEPKISVTTRSSPEICYRRATTPQSPAPIPPAAIQLGGGVADRSMSGLPTILEAFPRRSAPIQIPRRRAYSVAYPTPLSTIPASPRETSIKNYSGIQPGPKGNNQRNGRKFKTVRKVIKKPNQD